MRRAVLRQFESKLVLCVKPGEPSQVEVTIILATQLAAELQHSLKEQRETALKEAGWYAELSQLVSWGKLSN